MRLPRLFALPVALLLAGCGDVVGVDAEDPGLMPDDRSLLTTRGPVTVLDDGKGAELCLGGVATSLPPQCGGPKLIGWDWSEYAGHFEQVRGTRWGDFVVTGEYDGTGFTPTVVVPAAEWDREYPDEPTDFRTTCPEPEGGWRVLDPELTTERSQDAAFRLAARLDDYAGSWVDQSLNPVVAKLDDPEYQPSLEDELAMNDPTKTIINVQITGDPAAAEAKLREVWGGMLCISTAQHSERQLRRIQRELSDRPDMLSSGVDTMGNRVELAVTHDDGTLQRELDEKYGEGVVRVSSALVPAEE